MTLFFCGLRTRVHKTKTPIFLLKRITPCLVLVVRYLGEPLNILNQDRLLGAPCLNFRNARALCFNFCFLTNKMLLENIFLQLVALPDFFKIGMKCYLSSKIIFVFIKPCINFVYKLIYCTFLHLLLWILAINTVYMLMNHWARLAFFRSF